MNTPVDTVNAPDRPAWLAEIVAVLGEPRVKVENPTRLHRDGGTVFRRCWVWFPNLRNHNVHIDQYAKHWEIGAGCHGCHREVTVRSKTEPTDDDMRLLLQQAGWQEVADGE